MGRHHPHLARSHRGVISAHSSTVRWATSGSYHGSRYQAVPMTIWMPVREATAVSRSGPTTHVARRNVHERSTACCLEALDLDDHALEVVKAGRDVPVDSREVDEDVFVGQGQAQVVGSDRAADGHHCHRHGIHDTPAPRSGRRSRRAASAYRLAPSLRSRRSFPIPCPSLASEHVRRKPCHPGSTHERGSREWLQRQRVRVELDRSSGDVEVLQGRSSEAGARDLRDGQSDGSPSPRRPGRSTGLPHRRTRPPRSRPGRRPSARQACRPSPKS